SIDSRPSDSVALALRASAPIYASEELLGRTPLEIEPSEEEEETPDWMPSAGESQVEQGPPSASARDEERAGGEKLRDYLKGLDPEDFGRFVP
ncbi:MAG: bifunctional nuclease domain-containing protein, partial [Gemmatimonadota bacterium]